jgi:hypothetical protein
MVAIQTDVKKRGGMRIDRIIRPIASYRQVRSTSMVKTQSESHRGVLLPRASVQWNGSVEHQVGRRLVFGVSRGISLAWRGGQQGGDRDFQLDVSQVCPRICSSLT